MADEVKLLGVTRSPFSFRAEVGLKLKGVQHEFINEDLGNKSELLIKYNPIHKKIPVLVHNGKPICESSIILEYIDETWEGTPIFPTDPYEKANARFWVKYIDDKDTTLWKACWSQGEEKVLAIEEGTQILKTLESQALKDNKFFGGDSVGVIDIAAAFIGLGLGVIQEVTQTELFTEEKFPALFKWTIEFLNSPVIKETLPPRDGLIAFCRKQWIETGPKYKQMSICFHVPSCGKYIYV